MLQWKISHNIYPTAILLTKMGIKNSELCEKCNLKETTTHFFFECKMITFIWRELELLISANTNIKIKINAASALLGYVPEVKITKKDHVFINKVILIGKLVISKIKYGPKRNPREVLETELRIQHISY